MSVDDAALDEAMARCLMLAGQIVTHQVAALNIIGRICRVLDDADHDEFHKRVAEAEAARSEFGESMLVVSRLMLDAP